MNDKPPSVVAISPRDWLGHAGASGRRRSDWPGGARAAAGVANHEAGDIRAPACEIVNACWPPAGRAGRAASARHSSSPPVIRRITDMLEGCYRDLW